MDTKEVELGENAKREYARNGRVLTKIKEYALVGMKMNMMTRMRAVEENNQLAFSYNQGAIDVCVDILNILDGAELAYFEKKEVPDPMRMHQ